MKMELKYHSFREKQKNYQKLNFRSIFRTRNSEKSVFQDMGNLVKLVKNHEKSKIGPGRPGMLRKQPQTIFFGL